MNHANWTRDCVILYMEIHEKFTADLVVGRRCEPQPLQIIQIRVKDSS